MINLIINTIVTFLLGNTLGFCLSLLKKYKNQKDDIMEEFKQLKESELMDMRSDLSSKFYVYDSMPEVEDYLVISFQDKCQRYFALGGNNYIHTLYEKSFEWHIKQTGYLR